MIKNERLMSSEFISDEVEQNDNKNDRAIRPLTLDDYEGQKDVCKQMKIFLQAAKYRHDPLDHTLIFGPPGLGKTTLANILANEMGVQIKSTSGPILEKAGDLAALLTNLEENDILFVDEIHRLSPSIEEILYPAMEDYKLDIMIGEGPAARSIKIDLPGFTLVGATTRAGSLTSPLRDRFGIIQRLEFYDVDDLQRIVFRSSKILNINIQPEGAKKIALRSRGTPRIANRLLRRVRDYAEVCGNGGITEKIADDALKILNIDHQGLDPMDKKLMLTILDKFNGGPVGIRSLSAIISEDKETIEDVIEPYLIQCGFIMRTPRGRIATEYAKTYFQKTIKNQKNSL